MISHTPFKYIAALKSCEYHIELIEYEEKNTATKNDNDNNNKIKRFTLNYVERCFKIDYDIRSVICNATDYKLVY